MNATAANVTSAIAAGKTHVRMSGTAALSMLFLFLQTKLVVDYVSTCRPLLGVH